MKGKQSQQVGSLRQEELGYRQKLPLDESFWKLPDGQWLGLGSLTAGPGFNPWARN